MSLRWVVVWIAATVFAGSSIGEPINRAVAGGRPSVAEVMEELRGSSITCRDKLGQSRAYFHLDLIIASSQYGARVVEKFQISNDSVIRTVIDSDDGSLLGRVLTSTITYYDRAELRLTTSGASFSGLTTTCTISRGDVFVLSPRPSQNWSAYGEWVQLLSTRDRSEAIKLAAERRGASAFQHDNGWYVVVLGPFLPGVAESVRNNLASLGSIPNDSFVTDGLRFTDLVWGIQPSPHSLAPLVTTKAAPPEGGDGGTTFSMSGGAVVKISYLEEAGQKIALITLDGELKPGDHKSFNRAAIDAEFAIVALSSPGGDLQAGIEIGQVIRLKEFATVVPKDFSCASACALAWLAGQPRFMEPGARIGFHAPRRVDDPSIQADSAGSAIVGAYLNKLGLPSRAIAYFTEKRPADMQWLTFEDADRLGIYVKEFPR